MNSSILRCVASIDARDSESGGEEKGGLSLDHCRRASCLLARGPNTLCPCIRRLNPSREPSRMAFRSHPRSGEGSRLEGRTCEPLLSRQQGLYPLTPDG